MIDLTALEAEVTRDSEVDSSAATLITALAAAVEASKNDPVALQALVDRLRTQTDSLAGAVAANTL
jgi:hypothetical protein